jgi:hypothetical protein
MAREQAQAASARNVREVMATRWEVFLSGACAEAKSCSRIAPPRLWRTDGAGRPTVIGDAQGMLSVY